jgi:hypothetical protein
VSVLVRRARALRLAGLKKELKTEADMAQGKHTDACALGVAFIDAQLLMLYTHASLLAEWMESGTHAPDPSLAERLLAFRHARPEAHSHGEDGTQLKQSEDGLAPVWLSFDHASQRMAFALHVPCANAIIAVADFFDMHRLSASRAAEVQFLMRVRDAALNHDTFRLAHDAYMPHAAYGGLVIDETLDGRALFGDGTQPGFIAYGDVVGLLRYLRRLLKSMQSVISAGDAG